MITSRETEELKNLLSGRVDWYVWVLEYGITHHVMRLVLHKGDYPRGVEVMCSDVSYFCGPLQGGPYELKLHDGQQGGIVETILESIDGGLLIRGAALKIVRKRL